MNWNIRNQHVNIIKQNKEQIVKMSCPTYDQRYSLDFFLLNNHKRQQLRINCLFDITYIRRTRQYTNYISVLNVAFKVNINPVSILEVRVGYSRITPIIVLFHLCNWPLWYSWNIADNVLIIHSFTSKTDIWIVSNWCLPWSMSKHSNYNNV
jgi:hypothetical protein